jgi:hypothetical protein
VVVIHGDIASMGCIPVGHSIPRPLPKVDSMAVFNFLVPHADTL